MHSLRRRLSQRWQRRDSESPVNEPCQGESVDEAAHTSQDTALLPQTESRTVEDYSSGELHFIVDYVGSAPISEAQSLTRMMETLKRVKKLQIRSSIRVDFTIRDGILIVSCVESNSFILTAPLYAIALCAKEQLRGFDSTFGLNITRKKTHMCHVFQAGSQLEAASIVRTVALAFKAIGKMTREKLERETRRAKRTHSISSSERTRTNSEVSTTSTVGSSSERRHPHVQWKHGLEGASGRRSPHGKRFSKNSASPSILRHPSSSHTSGRHVEFSALSPVPSDGSDCDGKETAANQSKGQESVSDGKISVQADVHSLPSPHPEVPVWVKRGAVEPTRRSSLPVAQNVTPSSTSNPQESHSTEELLDQTLKEEDMPSLLVSRLSDQRENDLDFFPMDSNLPAKPQAKRALNESLEKVATSRDITSVIPEMGEVSENFLMTSSLLPIERFHKEAVISPDHAQRGFTTVEKYSNQPPELALGSDSEDAAEDGIIRLAIEAVERGEIAMVEKYLDNGLSVNAHDASRRSLLYYAVSLGYVEMSQLLLKRGADINWEGPGDKSPLHVAASVGNRAVTQLLLGHGANVRAKDSNFCTPLHMSAGHRSKLEVSFLLVEHGARIYENNIHGVRPVDLEPELKEMQRLLVQSACEAFAAADLTKSRSNSGASSINQSTASGRSKSSTCSPKVERVTTLRRGLFQHRRSSSLCSIPGGRGSPEAGRGKAPIRRSESIHLSRTLSPLLANSRRGGLTRLQSFQRTVQDTQLSSNSNQNIPDEHSNTEELRQPAVEPSDWLMKQANDAANVEKNVPLSASLESSTAQENDQPQVHGEGVSSAKQSKLPQEELAETQDEDGGDMTTCPTSEGSEEWQLSNQRTPQRPTVVESSLSSPDVQQNSFNPFELSTSPESSTPSLGYNPLSPFIPKRHILENERSVRDAVVSDLIQFGDNPAPSRVEVKAALPSSEGVEEATPSEEAPVTEEVKQPVRKHRRNSNVRQPSIESEHSVGGQRSTSECEESSLISTGSHYARDEELIIEAMEPVVHLSGNPECHSSLLAYLCLPRASGQLISLAHMDTASTVINSNIAVLIGNLFNLEGTDSRKRSVEAGLIETVLKLVDSTEPIQSTCLSILHNILEFNNDQEYSTALKTIPLEPLLNLLQTSDVDSGAFDLRHTDSPPPYPPGGHDRPRHRKRSTCSQSSFDDRPREMSPIAVSRVSVQRNNSGASDARSDVWQQHGGYTMQKKNSICSMGSSADGDHSFPLYSPGFGHSHLPLMDLHAKTMPRLVATKMLSASSVHPKMQVELGKTRPLSLLLETLTDSNPDIVIYSVATLANIAMTVDNHMQIELAGVVDGLKQMLSYGDARVRYHAARGLIYLGHMDVGGVYLFKRVPGDEKLDVLFADSTGEEHLFARGATVEKIVEIISNNPSLLWGSLRLPLSSRGKKQALYRTNSPGSRHAVTEEQIMDFLLTTCKSFVHSTILMRLLLHRFHDPRFGKYFDGDPSTGQMEQFSPLPVLHIYLMRLWTAWLDKYPEDFINNPIIATELSDVLIPMRQAGGPYLSCAKNLEELIHSLMERASKKGYCDRFQANHCHHAILYEQCQKAIVGGNLPCSVDDAIYLGSLQLYIEDLAPPELRGKPWFFSPSSRDKLSASRIKMSLNPSLYKVKNIIKRIKAQYEQFMIRTMTERNAKHNYIDCCQAMAGYGCQFYKLKECVGTVNPKVGMVRRHFGISPKKITLLDERTKAVIGTWQFKELKRWRSVADDTRLRVEFTNISFEFLLENKGGYKEINDVLLLCTKVDWQILAGQDFSPWSKYAEETEMWGRKAIEAVADKPALYTDKYESDSGVVSRLRAISLASSVPDQSKVKRHVSMSAKLSSSAPYQQGALQKEGRGKTVSPPGTEAVLATTAGPGTSAVSSGSPGNVSVGTHTSEELLLGSLQSTPGASKCSWEPGSLQATEGRRTSRESEASIDESSSPTEKHPLDPNSGFTFPQDIKHQRSSRHRKYTTESNTSSLGSDSPISSGQNTPNLPHRGPFSTLLRDEELPNVNRVFGLSPQGQLLICHCPPDAELPGFDRRDFTAYDLLQFPKELARQITLIDHDCFCAVTSTDIQRKLALGTGKRKKSATDEKLSVEKVADRFNQLSTWVVAGILTEESVEKRANMFMNFIETAKLCLELRNFNAVMAIVVAALGSAPVRRLHKTKELVPKEYLEQYAKMEILMDTKDNYKRYRQALASSPTPLVPYFGIYMKDLTFVTEGNPDFFKEGLINLTKRRQIYLVINEIRRFQKDVYNFQEVSEVRDYLASQEIHTEKELYNISRQLEPGLPRRHSEADKSASVGPVPQFKSNTVGRLAGRRHMSFSRSSTTLEAVAPESNC